MLTLRDAILPVLHPFATLFRNLDFVHSSRVGGRICEAVV